MPTNGLLITYFFGRVQGFNIFSSDADKIISHFTILVVFVATGIIPVIIAVILKQLKVISSLHMPRREERTLPFLLTGLSYLVTIYLLSTVWNLPLDPLIYQFMIGGALAIISGMFITISWKISVHMIGIGGVFGILVMLSKFGEQVKFYPIVSILIITGLIGYGRLNLKAHTIQQIIAGFLLGFICEIKILLVG